MFACVRECIDILYSSMYCSVLLRFVLSVLSCSSVCVCGTVLVLYSVRVVDFSVVHRYMGGQLGAFRCIFWR